jgi:hypothetical protein
MNNSIKYTIDEDFCKSKEYFIAMTRIHEFLKDVIVDDISDVKNDTMIKLFGGTTMSPSTPSGLAIRYSLRSICGSLRSKCGAYP